MLRAVTSFAVGVTMLAAAPAASGVAGAEGRVTGTRAPTAASLRVDDKRLVGHEQARFSGRLLDATTGDPIAGADVMLQWRRFGATGWQEGAVRVTGHGGRVDWGPLASQYSSGYRVVSLQTPEYQAAASDPRRVVVKPLVDVALKRDWVRPDGLVSVKGEVTRAYAGKPVLLQRKFDSGWATVQRASQGQLGRFAFKVSGTDSYGSARYRVQLPARRTRLGSQSAVVELTTVRLVTYRIETRGKVRGALDTFKERTAEIYTDPRGWSRAYVHFKRVATGGAFSLVLSQAKYVPSFGAVCDRYWSCRVGRYVVINENRWRHGTPYFKGAGGTMAEYRAMVVNHETGHWFGLGHATCGGAGQPAPVMMQQSKGLYGCEPNPWPLPGEISRVR